MEDPDERPTVPEVGPSLGGKRRDLIGVDVGGYLVDGEIGRGGMGVVYSATHPLIGKRAAIKVLKPTLSNNPGSVERFVQEARSVNAIRHPNIVDIFAFGLLPDGRSYLVMDLLEGESLRKRVKRGPLPVSEAALVIDEIASALRATHDKGFIHRDLKPDNVFLVANSNRFELKLLDFGLAKLSADNSMARVYRTATGTQLGTPDYMSPEQQRSSSVDWRTDVYALGVMSFEILVGQRPQRSGDGPFELDGKRPAEVVRAVPNVPGDLADLVEAMLATEPDRRPSLEAVRTVIKRLRPFLPALPSPLSGLPAVRIPTNTPVLSGLRTAGSHAATKLGVPPPPDRVSTPPRVQSQSPAARREWDMWLAVGAALVVATVVVALVLLS